MQLLCENANGNALWFVCVLFEGGDFEGGPCQITKKRQKEPFEVFFVFYFLSYFLTRL